MVTRVNELSIIPCPKCKEQLEEILYVSLFRCIRCNLVFLAKNWKGERGISGSEKHRAIDIPQTIVEEDGPIMKVESDSSRKLIAESESSKQETNGRLTNVLQDMDDPYGLSLRDESIDQWIGAEDDGGGLARMLSSDEEYHALEPKNDMSETTNATHVSENDFENEVFSVKDLVQRFKYIMLPTGKSTMDGDQREDFGDVLPNEDSSSSSPPSPTGSEKPIIQPSIYDVAYQDKSVITASDQKTDVESPRRVDFLRNQQCRWEGRSGLGFVHPRTSVQTQRKQKNVPPAPKLDVVESPRKVDFLRNQQRRDQEQQRRPMSSNVVHHPMTTPWTPRKKAMPPADLEVESPIRKVDFLRKKKSAFESVRVSVQLQPSITPLHSTPIRKKTALQLPPDIADVESPIRKVDFLRNQHRCREKRSKKSFETCNLPVYSHPITSSTSRKKTDHLLQTRANFQQTTPIRYDDDDDLEIFKNSTTTPVSSSGISENNNITCRYDRHYKPISGATPYIICCKCFMLVQVPNCLINSARSGENRLLCGECNKILVFSVKKREIVEKNPDSDDRGNNKKKKEKDRSRYPWLN